LKKMRKPFNPERTKFERKTGNLISEAQFAEEAVRDT
jgi:hypothetical protein